MSKLDNIMDMMKTNGGPFQTIEVDMASNDKIVCVGAAMRDYFAAAAMASLISKFDRWDKDNLADVAFEYADAMLRARLSKP